jgi:uncharacterized protein YecE (DUF72 family)
VRSADPQQDLFGGPDAEAAAIVGAAPQPALAAVAARLPRALRMGTSSWSFPGWRGLVYARPHREAELAKHGLGAYAQHPLLRAVGVDRAFYAPLRREEWQAFAAAVPDDFRFLVKAHAALTVPPGARRPAFLERAPEAFLDPGHAERYVLAPAVEGLGERLGVILLQFSPLPPALLREPGRLLARLHAFLRALPAGATWAIEWRDAAMLGRDYEALLAATGAVHGYSAHPRMPRLEAQLDAPARGPLVIRWLLERGQAYEEARSRYAPFDRLIDPDPLTRREIVSCVTAALSRGERALVIVNNKAEGSAPLSIAALAGEMAASRPPEQLLE